MNRGGSRHWPGVERPSIVTFGYIFLKAATSSFHSFSSGTFAADGMQSIESVTLAWGSSGFVGSDEPFCWDPPLPLSSLLLVPQAASAVSDRAETREIAAARRLRRNRALLMSRPLWAWAWRSGAKT